MTTILRMLAAGSFALTLVGCGAPDPASRTDEGDPAMGVEVTDATKDRVREIGEEAALALAGELFGRLSAELEAQGPVGAVAYCSAEALPATGRVAAALEDGLDIKRTSMKYRNPANAPDDLELGILKYFQGEYALEVEPPAYVIQKANEREYRYYKPLVVVPPCLACHGNPDDMSEELRATLAESYPDDLATGYEAGDFRGVIRVSIPAEALQPSG